MKYLLVLLIFCFVSKVSWGTPKRLSMGGFIWPPHQMYEKDGSGVALNLLKKIFLRAGYHANVGFYPWARTQHMVRTGELDGLTLAWFTKERNEYAYYSKPFVINRIMILKRKDFAFHFRKRTDLYGKHVGALRGFGYYDLIKEDSIRKSFVKKLGQNLMKLYKKRIDLTIATELSAYQELAKLPKKVRAAIEVISTPLEIRALHMAISRANPHHKIIVKDFNQALSEMAADGSYKKIIEGSTPRPTGVFDQ